MDVPKATQIMLGEGISITGTDSPTVGTLNFSPLVA